MRGLAPWALGFVVLLALWPVICMSGEDGPTTCQSAVFLTLPWGDSADTWGFAVAIGASVATFVAVRLALRPRVRSDS